MKFVSATGTALACSCDRGSSQNSCHTGKSGCIRLLITEIQPHLPLLREAAKQPTQIKVTPSENIIFVLMKEFGFLESKTLAAVQYYMAGVLKYEGRGKYPQ